MGKKMKLLPSLLLKKSSSSSSSWASWPSCNQQPKTLSFRSPPNNNNNTIFNSAYIDPTIQMLEDPSIEIVDIRGLRSDRLFFEPNETSSLLEAKAAAEAETTPLPFKETMVMSMDSRDPYTDFRRSMEEMVEAHGVKDWEALEDLLCSYLKVNGKSNHGYILGAFVDLLVSLALLPSITTTTASSSSSTSTSTSYSPSSPLSFYSSSMSSSCSTRCVSCLEPEDEVETTTSSTLSLEQVKEEIKLVDEDEASSSFSSNAN